MRDFSCKMQQMRDFSCKNQGREPGRPKKNVPPQKNANLISRPVLSVRFPKECDHINPAAKHPKLCTYFIKYAVYLWFFHTSIHTYMHACMHEHLLIVYFSKDMYIIPMNISSIKWEGSRHAIFRFMYLQLQPFRGSLTLFYSDFKVVGEICRDLFRFLQCSHDPGCSYPQPLIIWSKMPRVGAQPLKGSPALCHVKTCSGKMGKPFLCIPSFWFQCCPTATTQKAGFNLSTH